ncbi:mechanosensitive ion channel [candidate division KSB1 bacterium]|nr:mechanosensitive ion channel [candidate division KSB1 bacterium]
MLSSNLYTFSFSVFANSNKSTTMEDCMESVQEVFKGTYFNNSLGQYLMFFGIIILGIIVGRIIYYIFKTRLRKLAAKSKTKFDDYLIDIIEEPLVLLIVTIAFYLGTMVLTLNDPAQKFFDNVILVLIAATITWFIIRLFDMLVRIYLEPLVRKSESRLDDQILPIIRKSIKFAVLIMAFIVVLSNLGYDILSVLAGLGIGGLAFALAAQDTVKNIIGGITIFWDKPFQILDFIEINGKTGTVDEVGLRTTRIRTIGGTTVVIPNSHVADSMLENYSTRDKRRMVLTIGLTYETSSDKMEQAIQIINDTIKSIDGTDKEDILTRFINFGPYSLDLEVAYWITDMVNWKMVIHQVNIGIKRNLDEAGVDMAFPTETHYVINQK